VYLDQGSGTLVNLFRKLYEEMMSNKPWLDIDRLIKLEPFVLGGKSELTDCLAGLFRLFGSPIPRMTSQAGVIFNIDHGTTVSRYFSELRTDSIAERDVIFFGTRSLVLKDIPETLGDFSLYVVINRLSKTNHRLWVQDSEGWLSIHGRDIEEASSFRRDNISLLGYIRNLNSTNVFRFPLNCDHLVRKPSGKMPSRHITDISQVEFVESETASVVSLPEIQRDFSVLHPKKRIRAVIWSDPEKSPWGSEQRKTIDIESDATGSDLLKVFGECLDVPQDLSTGHEIVKVCPDLERMEMISPTELINATDGDVFHIQPEIPPAQACHVAVIIGSQRDAPPIDFRRIRISSGQLNLSTDIPQNSFRSMVAKLVGGWDRVNYIDVVMEENGVQTRESDGIFVLGLPVADGVKHLSHVRIAVKSGFPQFDRLASDLPDHKDQTQLPSFPRLIPIMFSDSPSDPKCRKRISRPVSQYDSESEILARPGQRTGLTLTPSGSE
jgi:hypothetical protein